MSKSTFYFISIALLSILISCVKDSDLTKLDEQKLKLNQLQSEKARNFFNYNFCSNANTHIIEALTPRGNEFELIDSLYNSLIDLEISNPFAENLIDTIGYPIWTNAAILQPDSIMPCIVLPTANLSDSTTRGLIVSVLQNGDWYSWFITRDTLYSFENSTSPDTNVAAYAASILFFDHTVFSYRDTIMFNIYNSNHSHFANDNETITLRTDCFRVQVQYTYEGPCCYDLSYYNPDCVQEYTGYYTTFWCFGSADGGPSGVGQGVGTLGPSGGGGGGGGSDGGSSNNNPCPCDCNLTGAAYLCQTELNLYSYGSAYISAYNSLLKQLGINSTTAQYLLHNFTLSDINNFRDFINTYSADKQLNGSLLLLYFSYFQQVSTRMSLIEIADIASPYFKKLNYYERLWLFTHPEIFNNDGIELFLASIAQKDVDINSFQDCMNPSINWQCVLDNINWYYAPVAGKDWYFDPEFWGDPNLDFQDQARPTYATFSSNFPSLNKSAESFYNELGGDLLKEWNKNKVLETNIMLNTCALRVSIALNESGVIIPYIDGATLADDNGKYYFLNAASLNYWLKLTFGWVPNSTYIQKKSPQDDPIDSDSFGDENNRGIFTMLAKDPDTFRASGHADLWDGVKCKTVGGGCYFKKGSEYNLWILE